VLSARRATRNTTTSRATSSIAYTNRSAYAIRAARAAAQEGEREADERDAAGRRECEWQRAQLPEAIRELVLDDQRLRNELCWFVFDV
jgi:hypothetical protein